MLFAINHKVIAENLEIFGLAGGYFAPRGYKNALVFVSWSMQPRTARPHRCDDVLLNRGKKVLLFDKPILVEVADWEDVALFELAIVGCPLLDCVIGEVSEEAP